MHEPSIAPIEPSVKDTPKIQWVVPQTLDRMTFVGKNVLAVAHDIYIMFINTKTLQESVYLADSAETGDGVDVIAGHKSSIFAFSEKVNQGRVLLVQYPSFKIVSNFRDMEVNRYKGLCMLDCDLIATTTGFTNYLITIWNWRTCVRMVAVPTGILRRLKMFVASSVNMFICECWGEGLHVWEVALCFKKCVITKRTKEEQTGWDALERPLETVCWSSEGQLYCMNSNAVLYSVYQAEGSELKTKMEWDAELQGPNKVCLCALPNALLTCGPDNHLRLLKKNDNKWTVEWTHEPLDSIVRLINNNTCDRAAVWTRRGQVYSVRADPGHPVEMTLVAYKHRNIKKIQFLAPDFDYVALLNEDNEICIYEVNTFKLITFQSVQGEDVNFQVSPEDPVLAIVGLVSSDNYGLVITTFSKEDGLTAVANICLTHQIVEQVYFSPSGRELVAAAMSAGHIFLFKLSREYKLSLLRYAEAGRGLADCFFANVGTTMRLFLLTLISDKYLIGERVLCYNAETGKDNKFAGKMSGPYQRMLPLALHDTLMAIPLLSRDFHLLKLSGDKGVTVQVRLLAVHDTHHMLKQYDAVLHPTTLLTFGYDGTIMVRKPDAPDQCELTLTASHRYALGVRSVHMSADGSRLVYLSHSGAAAVVHLSAPPDQDLEPELEPEQLTRGEPIVIVDPNEKNYLDTLEEKKVQEEAISSCVQTEELVLRFQEVQAQLVELLEQNLAAPELHQLSLSEFNLHQEARRDRLKQAEKEREEIRLDTEARIKAQDTVTAWIKTHCWDTMLTQRIKLLAIFSHYQVENYPTLPSQRDTWPELKQIEALRAIEKENDLDLFCPWDENVDINQQPAQMAGSGGILESVGSFREYSQKMTDDDGDDEEEEGRAPKGDPYVLSGTVLHKFVSVPEYSIPQTLAYSFLHMNWLQEITKLNTQNMRIWFNKQFDELMTVKKREVALVEERNSRLRFIVEELNKLSDLRGSFHHLIVGIYDPQWTQEEQPHRLIKVDPEECSIEPYVSPSQIVIVPPDPGPKDDFRERALMDMMDGVLEKLWHEEIKKPIPPPQCMLEKDPEHFNEEDLRQVFDYEAKVAFRNEEREKYRKMLHAEYAKLSQILNEGVVKFNMRVKDMWLLRLKVDSVIGQENLNLMRLRRTNLDRIERAEEIEAIRKRIAKHEAEIHHMTTEMEAIQKQSEDCHSVYEIFTLKDKQLEKTFKIPFADQSPIVFDQCFKFYKKRPKWHHRASMTPNVLYEMASAVMMHHRPPLLHPDCLDYLKALDQMDNISNMPPILEEVLWVTVVRLRRSKIENEIRMRAVAQDMAYVDAAHAAWSRAVVSLREEVAHAHQHITKLRADVEAAARNKTIQLVLPAGQVEIMTSGHFEDFEDASLILRDDIEAINNLILKVGELKLRMMRKQMEFRKGILSKEWEHAQMRMKLRHMSEELYTYQRLRIPKELQFYLKNLEKGVSDEQDYVKMEKEMEASKAAINKVLNELIQRYEELEVKLNNVQVKRKKLEDMITRLNMKVSEKRHTLDPLDPIRRRRALKIRMEVLVERSKLIREVQANHTTIVILQTELELARLRTFPTLAKFKTLS